MNKKITIEITDGDVEKLLLDNLKDSPNKKLIAKNIINHLIPTDMGIEAVYKSFMGIDRQLNYTINQQVWVNIAGLSTWRMNTDLMKSHNRIFQNHVRATITDVLPYNKACYRVDYEILVKDATEELTAQEYNYINESYIKPIEEIIILEK